MPETRNMLGLSRRFQPTDGWDGFYIAWQRAKTSEEAAGVLRLGMSLPTDGLDERQVSGAVSFYLRWSMSDDSQVSKAAQQVLMGYWVRQVLTRLPLQEEGLGIHAGLLDLLSQPISPAITGAQIEMPVRTYLVNLLNAYCDGKAKGELLSLSLAMFSWGIGTRLSGLADPQDRKVVMEAAEVFLRKHPYTREPHPREEGGVLERVPAGLSRTPVQELLSHQAYFVLARLRRETEAVSS